MEDICIYCYTWSRLTVEVGEEVCADLLGRHEACDQRQLGHRLRADDHVGVGGLLAEEVEYGDIACEYKKRGI